MSYNTFLLSTSLAVMLSEQFLIVFDHRTETPHPSCFIPGWLELLYHWPSWVGKVSCSAIPALRFLGIVTSRDIDFIEDEAERAALKVETSSAMDVETRSMGWN